VTGRVFYNPFTTQIYEYPTFAQTIDYEPFEVNSKDGSKFTVDPSMIVKVKDGKSPFIFKKYRKELSDVIKGSLYIYVKDAARIEFNKYTADMIVSNREAVDKSFENRVRQAFEKEGFELEQLTPGIAYPSSYEEAINAKNKAIQDQMRVENEVKVAEANAKKILVAAQAEAEANRLKQQALTPQILQKMWIEKWNGTLPTVITSGNSSTFLDISKLK
jgi:regulator of protease activity HflC (stomatin/prohibitin superfamily)